MPHEQAAEIATQHAIIIAIAFAASLFGARAILKLSSKTIKKKPLRVIVYIVYFVGTFCFTVFNPDDLSMISSIMDGCFGGFLSAGFAFAISSLLKKRRLMKVTRMEKQNTFAGAEPKTIDQAESTPAHNIADQSLQEILIPQDEPKKPRELPIEEKTVKPKKIKITIIALAVWAALATAGAGVATGIAIHNLNLFSDKASEASQKERRIISLETNVEQLRSDNEYLQGIYNDFEIKAVLIDRNGIYHKLSCSQIPKPLPLGVAVWNSYYIKDLAGVSPCQYCKP